MVCVKFKLHVFRLGKLMIDPVFFESMMLVCFGSAWPFSIWKLLKTKSSKGKSLGFILILLLGYIFGVLFEVTGEMNSAFYLYIINIFLVCIDLTLTLKYRKN